MGFTVAGFNQAKSEMASVFNKALDDAERLRKAAVDVSSDASVAAPAGSLEVPGNAGVNLVDASRAAVGSPGNPIGKAAV